MKASHVLHRALAHDYPVAVSGHGCEIVDSEGRRYLDASSGAAVSSLGHSHPDVLAEMHAQLDRLEFAHTSFFTTPVAEALADDLVRYAPAGFRLCQFVSGGSEAVEAALKMTRQYHLEVGEPQRRIFIARRQSYHGSTLGALAMTDRRGARELFEPLLTRTGRVSPCFEYRGRDPGETNESYVSRLGEELEAEIGRLGPENVAGFVAETVVGATLGAATATPGYFKTMREICDRHGILLILDEVMAGMGRTGSLYAFEQEQVTPDLVALAKGLAAGYAPIGAVLVRDRVASAFQGGSGAFRHGHTYIGHPLACAAALAVQQVIRRDDLLDNVRRQGAHLDRRLRERLGNNAFVGDIRGRGLLRGVELVLDRADKRPFPSHLKIHALIRLYAFQAGLTVFGMGGTVDGREGDHIMLAPPFIVSPDDVDEIVDRLGDAIDRATAEAFAETKAA